MEINTKTESKEGYLVAKELQRMILHEINKVDAVQCFNYQLPNNALVQKQQ